MVYGWQWCIVESYLAANGDQLRPAPVTRPTRLYVDALRGTAFVD
jgi:hypothetical protein